MNFFQEFRTETKLLLVVVLAAVVLVVGGILLLKGAGLGPSSPTPAAQTPSFAPQPQPQAINNQQQIQEKELVWEERFLTEPEEEAYFVGWSPDDSEILYRSDKGNNEWSYGTLAASRTRKNFSLWIVNPDGSGKRKLWQVPHILDSRVTRNVW
ncbi:MAG TPA: hypothetical protein VGA53_03775 [Candidatus Paceibacterota bacterium]